MLADDLVDRQGSDDREDVGLDRVEPVLIGVLTLQRRSIGGAESSGRLLEGDRRFVGFALLDPSGLDRVFTLVTGAQDLSRFGLHLGELRELGEDAKAEASAACRATENR